MTKENSTMLKNGAWGAALGAIAVMIIGFNFGGWVTASTAKESSDAAVLASKAVICVAQFKSSPKFDEQLKAFEETSSWRRNNFVEEGGWDKMPGEEIARTYVSSACSDAIEGLLEK